LNLFYTVLFHDIFFVFDVREEDEYIVLNIQYLLWVKKYDIEVNCIVFNIVRCEISSLAHKS